MPRVSDVPQRILKYISDYGGQYGFAPTIREICTGIHVCSTSTVHRHVTRLKKQGVLSETKPGRPRSLAISSAVSLEGKVTEAKHLCLQTSDGGTLILDCKAVDGRLEFTGPINAAGLHSAKTKVIGCRELDEDDYYDAMVMLQAENCPPFI